MVRQLHITLNLKPTHTHTHTQKNYFNSHTQLEKFVKQHFSQDSCIFRQINKWQQPGQWEKTSLKTPRSSTKLANCKTKQMPQSNCLLQKERERERENYCETKQKQSQTDSQNYLRLKWKTMQFGSVAKLTRNAGNNCERSLKRLDRLKVCGQTIL